MLLPLSIGMRLVSSTDCRYDIVFLIGVYLSKWPDDTISLFRDSMLLVVLMETALFVYQTALCVYCCHADIDVSVNPVSKASMNAPCADRQSYLIFVWSENLLDIFHTRALTPAGSALHLYKIIESFQLLTFGSFMYIVHILLFSDTTIQYM